ncbi:MAG: type II toxin-antitoxin system HipA family toxin, partial [Candidatus Fermentibacteria bacterium]|nr:type II toxin-antitoxin system HipA family toxin [Candidatus Fermentibacteria bacterium]
MGKSVFVYIDLEGHTHHAGHLWIHVRGRRESATFEYARSWMQSPSCFALDPALSIKEGPHHTGIGLPIFGAIGDSAPDRWGRILMRRFTRRTDKAEGKTPRTLREIDYLLGVNDETRMGALRFSLSEGGPFLAQSTGNSIPPLVDLPGLLAASDKLLKEEESTEDLRLLLAPGSSLGGAQPKASLQKDSQLFIAKFPNNTDDHNRIVWEAIALDLAERSGIRVPERSLRSINGRDILILKRFDRKGKVRIPFLSGMSMISAKDNEVHSYLELADKIRSHGAFPKNDMHELWKRIVVTVLISNIDDHMRNHGFLYYGREGWILSPAYDLNPTPTDL